MGYYKPAVNYEPHNFNSSVFQVNNPDLDGPTVIQGVDTIEVEYTENRWGTQMVADGSAIHVHNPSKQGTVKITLLDASESTDTLATLAASDAPIFVSFTDQNAPNLKVSSAQARLEKHAVIKRGMEVATPEWVFVCTYLEGRAGAYKQQTVE